MIIQPSTEHIFSVFPSPKFIRRKDLTTHLRISITLIAYDAQINHSRGVISDLAKQHNISRTLIYSFLDRFKAGMNSLFSPFSSEKEEKALEKKQAKVAILAQRFEGSSSIEGISSLLERRYKRYHSVGFISQFLSFVGGKLPNVLINTPDAVQLVAFASDEIFSKSTPILITVDPISSAILKIELVSRRTADQWAKHWKDIQHQGFCPTLLTSDAGVALCAAQAEGFADLCWDVPWQSDTFHGIAHRLGDWVRRLEKSAYTCIEYYDKCLDKLASAKTDSATKKQREACSSAQNKETKATDLYHDFFYLYRELIRQLNIFNSEGNLRQREAVEGEMTAALELMASFPSESLCKSVASSKRALPDLLTYLDDAPRVLKRCRKLVPDETLLKALSLAWQWNKSVIKAKVTSRKKQAIEQRDFHLELAYLLADKPENCLKLKKKVWAELDQIIQASSMVECINSILRPYLNHSKNQVTQEFLNTFMFYHNNRRYRSGKRKAKTPMELLTGKSQAKDWIERLFETIKEPNLPA